MFIDNSIPEEYNKIAEVSDNYVVLVRENTLNSNNTYNAYYQFFNPSTQVLFVNNYKIKNNTNTTTDYHYTNNQMFSYIDYTENTSTISTSSLVGATNDLYDRGDIANVGLLVALHLFLVIIIVNLATSLIHRGGIFHA